MKKNTWIAAVLGIGLVAAPWAAFAQAPDGQSGEHAQQQKQEIKVKAAPAPDTIPPDQQPSKEQLAKLFEVMRVREQLDSVSKMMPALLQQQFSSQLKEMQKDHPEMGSMTDEQQQAYKKVMDKFMEKVMKLYTGDEMIADMSDLYRKHLSSSDVDGMIAFYSSPAGQHMLDTVPAIMKEFMPMVMQRVQERIKPLADEMTKELGDIVKTPAADSTDKK
jgi:hypothetical protein